MTIIHRCLIISGFLLSGAAASGQVQVSKEPFHKPVYQNAYFRLLDVWLKPGDTTGYHIHSTPSAFLCHTSYRSSAQEQGKQWTTDTSKAGYSWYRSFTPDSMIHRVTNCDTVMMHVTDLEILQRYGASEIVPLPLDVIFENDRVIGYRINEATAKGQQLQARGPMLAQLVSGQVQYNNLPTGEELTLKAGEFLYIFPGNLFELRNAGKGTLQLFLYEVK